MSETAQKLLEQIRALSPEDRRWVAGQMWEPDEWSDDQLADLQPIPDRPTSAVAADLWRQVATLSQDDRVFIADGTLQELQDGSEWDDDPEFQAMLAERLEQVEKHPELLLDGDEVMAELRRRYGGEPA